MFLPVGQSEARLAGLAQEASWSPRLESAIKMLGFVICFVGVFIDFSMMISLSLHVKRQRPVIGQATSLTADSPKNPRVLYNIT